MREVREHLRKNPTPHSSRIGNGKWKPMNQNYLLHKTICLHMQLICAEWWRVINSKWDKATSINGISLKIGCRPTMSDLPKAMGACLHFKCTLYLPHLCLPTYASHVPYLRHALAFSRVPFRSVSLCLSLSRPASSSAARKIVSRDCQKYALRTHLSVRLHLSVRCRSQDDGGIAQHRRDDWKYSVAGFSRRGFRNSLADAASRRLACL